MEEFNNWSRIASVLPSAVSQAVKKVAFDLQAEAQSNAPVDTGFLRNSISTEMINSTTARVSVGAPYGVYVELGTRNMPAQPYFYPAVDHARENLGQAMQSIKAAMESAASARAPGATPASAARSSSTSYVRKVQQGIRKVGRTYQHVNRYLKRLAK